MCRVVSFILLQRLKGSISGDARDFNNTETRSIIKFFFFQQGKTPKEIHAILKETLGEHASWHATVRNWVAQFKRGVSSTLVAPRPGRAICTHIQYYEELATAKVKLGLLSLLMVVVVIITFIIIIIIIITFKCNCDKKGNSVRVPTWIPIVALARLAESRQSKTSS